MTVEKIELELREALSHLYDPDYLPSADLYELSGCSPQAGALAVQTAIIGAIERMKPAADTPRTARIRQVYELLRNRFVLKLTLEETADRMDMSYSSTWRAQRVAVHSLTQTLWSLQALRMSSSDSLDGPGEGQTGAETFATQGADWRSQMDRELASLHACAPDRVADVEDVVAGLMGLAGALAPGRRLRIDVKHMQPGLVASVHPAVLRQALIAAMRKMATGAGAEEVSLYAGLDDGNVKITFTGDAASADPRLEDLLVDGLLLPDGMSAVARVDRGRAFLHVEAPSVGRTTVLIVDDNPDMARFYRRAAEGTSYRIVHIDRGQQLFIALETAEPDAIVLDVMLPDIDGWQLLMRLHEDPRTRPIPVIICTVVREEELARSLGAAGFLTKPVRPTEFIEALDRVVPLASKAGQPTEASTAVVE